MADMTEAHSSEAENQLFKDVFFFITTACSEEVKQLLKQGGAKREFYISDLVTHVITDSAEFPQLGEAKEFNLPIVMENWVTMSIKANTLLPTKPFSPNSDKLFSGVVVCPSQIAPDDLNVLWAMMTYYGGSCQLSLTSSCTHLVIPKPDGDKYKCAVKFSDLFKIVTPRWVTDSIRENKRLPEEDYLPVIDEQLSTTESFLTPEDDAGQIPTSTVGSSASISIITNEGIPVIPNRGTEKPTEMPSTLMSPVSPTAASLTSDVKTTEQTEKHSDFTTPDDRTLTQAEKQSDVRMPKVGTPAQAEKQSDVRMPNVGTPAQAEKQSDVRMPEVGTPSQDEKHSDVRMPDVKTSTLAEKQADVRVAAQAEKHFDRISDIRRTPDVITLARAEKHSDVRILDVRTPIQAEKQSDDRTLTQVEKHADVSMPDVGTPVQAKKHSDIKETESNIRETPVRTEAQPSDGCSLDVLTANQHAGESKQTDAVSSAMLVPEQPSSRKSTVLQGCVFVVDDYQNCMEHSVLDTWIEVIELHEGSVSPFYSKRCTHLLCLNQMGSIFKKALEDGKAIVTAHWLNDVLVEGKMFPPSNPLHLPIPFLHKLPGCRSMSISATGYTGKERQIVRNMVFVIGANYTGYMMRTNTHLICKSPDSTKYQKAREWGIPCINATWLGDIVSGGQITPCALSRYSKLGEPDELSLRMELVKHLVEPWKDYLVKECNQLKRKPEEPKENPEAKRRRLSNSSIVEINSNTPRVLFTGIPLSRVTRLRKIVVNLGGQLAESHRNCTHLVATKIVRTVKFLSAISVSQHIVTPSWLEKSHELNQFADPSLFLLQDLESEKLYDMNLQQSSTRAHARRCLQGVQVYVSPNVEPCPASMKEIIECAGGQMLTAVPSQRSLATLKTLLTSEGTPAFVVVTCPSDVPLCCVDFVRCGIDLYSTELILAGVMQQQVTYENYKFTLQ